MEEMMPKKPHTTEEEKNRNFSSGLPTIEIYKSDFTAEEVAELEAKVKYESDKMKVFTGAHLSEYVVEAVRQRLEREQDN